MKKAETRDRQLRYQKQSRRLMNQIAWYLQCVIEDCPYLQVFPSTSTVGNISLTEHSITYQFQVSASVTVGQTSNEGDLSPLSPNTTVFIPRPGRWNNLEEVNITKSCLFSLALPVPTNLHMINFTNISITLGWEYPPPPAEAFEKFLVSLNTS